MIIKKIIFLLSAILLISTPAHAFEDWGEELQPQEEVKGTITLQEEFLDGDILKISAYTNDMLTPVLGIAFHLVFNSDQLSFLRYTPGNFLESGGDPFYLVQNKESKIFFGQTLRRDDAFPIGSGLIAEFYFQIITSSDYTFEFKNNVISTLDVIRQDLDNIIWESLFIPKDKKSIMTTPMTVQASVLPAFKNSTTPFLLIIPLIILIVLISTVLLIKKQKQKRSL